MAAASPSSSSRNRGIDRTQPATDAYATSMELSSGRARAVIAPERGALVKSWIVNGRELLYLDDATFNDPTKNVRGGNPVLFPSPGKLEGDRYPRGEMKQHGFARNLPWRVAGEDRLVLEANDITRAQYPWD